MELKLGSVATARNVMLAAATMVTAEMWSVTHPISTPADDSPAQRKHGVVATPPRIDTDLVRSDMTPLDKYGLVDFGNGCGSLPSRLNIKIDCSENKTDLYFKSVDGMETPFVEYNGRRIRVSKVGGVLVQNIGNQKDIWYVTNIFIFPSIKDKSRYEQIIGEDIMLSGDTILIITRMSDLYPQNQYQVWASHDGVEWVPVYMTNKPRFDNGLKTS
ncbi:hypothetical protein HY045_01225 [Candidatus Woesebacteria bacterium]|nr:hypothetical protein [Candidatus Woesebacteria bacterium]